MRVWAIAKNEFKRYFISPIGWCILAIVQLVIAFMYVERIGKFLFEFQPQMFKYANPPGVTDIVILPIIAFSAGFLMWIVPIVAMNSFAEERKNNTMSLLQSSPLSMIEIVLGKYIGILMFFGVMVFMIAVMMFSLELDTSLDLGKIISGLIGLSFLISLWTAVTLFFSSLTKSSLIAAIVSFGVIRFFWDLNIDVSGFPQTDAYQTVGAVLFYVSTPQRFGPMAMGIMQTSDISYFIVFSALFLLLTIRRLDSERLRY